MSRKKEASDIGWLIVMALLVYALLKLLGLLPEILPDPVVSIDTLIGASITVIVGLFALVFTMYLKMSDISEKIGSLTERVNQNTRAIQELKTIVNQNTQLLQELKTTLA